MKQLFVAWVPFQRRSLSMKKYFGYELKFLSFSFQNRILRPFEYILKSFKTSILLLSYKPDKIWVQLPPTPILHLAHLYKKIFNPQVQIIADCHNATFRSPWIKIPGTVNLLNQSNLVLIHNDSVKEQAIAHGIDFNKLHILEDPPAIVEDKAGLNQNTYPHPWVLCPCSFNHDEPIETIFDAASVVPEITFVLTGKTSRAKGIHDLSTIPPNVHLPGFLAKSEFDNLLCNTDIVLGLTKLEGIQLSVANEAVGIGKPMVLANTKILKKLFYKGAIYVDAIDAKSIIEGCKEALLKKEELTKKVNELREERNEQWLNQASTIIKS